MTSRVMIWFQAARPKTLWAAFGPVLVGTSMAFGDGLGHWPSAVAALAGALLIQIGTNFCNDYADFKKGADTANRKGPLRVTQAGLVSPRTMLRATVLVFALASGLALYLVWRAGWPLLVVGILSITFGVLYTAGPLPLAYVGVADLFVLVFFGPVAVGGTYYVQALRLPVDVLVAGLAPGLLAVAILIVNNLRDVNEDARAGKRTLVVRLGPNVVEALYAACLIGALAVPCWLFLRGGLVRPWLLLPLLLLPVFGMMIRKIRGCREAWKLNPALGQTASLLLAYSILFALGWSI